MGPRLKRGFKDISRICKLRDSATDPTWHLSVTSRTIQDIRESLTDETQSLIHILGTASSKEQENITSPRLTRTYFGKLCVFVPWILKGKMWRLAVAISVWDILRWNSDNKHIVISKVVHVRSSITPDKCHSAPEERVFK